MFLLRLSAVEEKEGRCTSRREKSSSLNGPRLRGQATSIWRVIPGAVGRAPKISNARVIEEPPQLECIKVLLLEDTTAASFSPSSSYHPCLLLLFLAFLFLGVPLSIVVFSIVRDNDTHTLSLGNNINGFVYPETIGGPAKGTSRGTLTRKGSS